MKFYDGFFEIARLKDFMVTMIIKIILVALIFGLTSSSGFSFGTLVMMLLVYTLVTMYFAVSKAVGNWYLGIFVFIGLFVGIAVLLDKLPNADFISVLLIIVLIAAGPVLDISRVVRLIKLTKLKKEQENSAESVSNTLD